MPYAYVGIHTVSGNASDVLDAITEISEVGEAHVVAGDFDLIIELEIGSTGQLDYADSPVTGTLFSIVTEEIQGIPGVKSTRTYIVLD